MKRLRKYAALFATCVCLISTLTGCTQIANELITSVLQWNFEASYLGKFNKRWLELSGLTFEEANQSYLDHLEAEAEYFVNYWGIVDSYYGETYMDLNEEFRSAVVSLINEIYSHSKFEVLSAVAQDDGSYAVKVTVSPIDVVNQAYEIWYNDEFEPLNAFYAKYTDEVVDAMTDEEYMAYTLEYGNLILYLMHEQMDNLGYMDTKTQSIQMEMVNGLWEINEDDLYTFDSYVIYYP